MRPSSLLCRLLPALLAAAVALTAPLSATHPRFYDDDPIAVEPETQDASGVRPWKIDLVFDLFENTFAMPGGKPAGIRARNVNSIDEVPDSSWWTRRAGTRPLTAAAVVNMGGRVRQPAAGPLTIVAAKTDGITPGFTVTDAAGLRWFVKFDPAGYPTMATGTEVTVTRLMWALGYHVPTNVIARFRREDLQMGDGVRITRPGEPARRMTARDIDRLLAGVAREADGRVRAVMSLALPGHALGGFRFHGTRPDDPNDVVPHQHRRELRGYSVFAAWLNHVDSKATNTLDTLTAIDGRPRVRHHLLDFGSALGSAAVFPREAWEGHEYLFEGGGRIGRRMLAVGLVSPAWRSIDHFESPAVGRLPRDSGAWDPAAWRPRVPNAAFRHARADDRFWAARQLAAIDDQIIRAAIDAGEFAGDDSRAFLTRTLIERRDAIFRAYLPAVNPIVAPRLDASGRLTFGNAAVDAGVAAPPAEYRADWYAFDNATGTSMRLGQTVAGEPSMDPPAALGYGFVRVAISAISPSHPEWARPVETYFRREPQGWRLVGLARQAGE